MSPVSASRRQASCAASSSFISVLVMRRAASRAHIASSSAITSKRSASSSTFHSETNVPRLAATRTRPEASSCCSASRIGVREQSNSRAKASGSSRDPGG